MDFRSTSKLPSSRLAIPTTVLTPQLESYDLFNGFRELPKSTSSEAGHPFMLVFNLASVLESELKITRIRKKHGQDDLQVEVAHSRREAEGVPPFARDCTYRFHLPEDLYHSPLTALWTRDHHLIVVESSNFIQVLTAADENVTDVSTQVEEGAVAVPIEPRKVNCVFKSTLNIEVLRHSMTLAELELFNAKRIVQNASFTCPDIGRPLSPDKKPKKYVVEKKTEILPYEGFMLFTHQKVMAEQREKAGK